MWYNSCKFKEFAIPSRAIKKEDRMFKEEVVEKPENPATVIPKEFIRSTFYGAIIHFLNYSLRLPAIFSLIPLMILILIIMLFKREQKNKKRQYAFLIPYVAEFFGFCLYFYDRGNLMFVTAGCMTAILATWGVICIECFAKNKKKNVIGFATLLAVACAAYFGIWAYYNAQAKDMTERIASTQSPDVALAGEADALCKEINAVFYSKTKLIFQYKMAAENAAQSEGFAALCQKFKGNLEKIEDKWISSLFREAETLSKEAENTH